MKKSNKKASGGSKGRPPYVPKAGIKHGTRYCGGGKLK